MRGRRAAWLLCVAGLAACGGGQPEGVWTGPLTPATPGRGCEPAQAVLTLRAGRFQFAPTGGVLVLEGRAEADGRLHATLAAPGMDRKPFVQTFDAQLRGDMVEGRFVTPRCTATVALRRNTGRGFVQDLLRH